MTLGKAVVTGAKVVAVVGLVNVAGPVVGTVAGLAAIGYGFNTLKNIVTKEKEVTMIVNGKVYTGKAKG